LLLDVNNQFKNGAKKDIIEGVNKEFNIHSKFICESINVLFWKFSGTITIVATLIYMLVKIFGIDVNLEK